MKHHKKLIIILIIVSLLIFIISVPFIYSAIKYSDETILFEERWEINLPDYDKVIYKAEKETVWQDPCNYIIFKLKENPDEFLKDFSYGSNEDFENAIQEFLKISKSSLNIEAKYLPNLEQMYIWKAITVVYDKSLHMIYYPETLELILCESL